MAAFSLPMDFMIGTASSSCQIEGGDKNNTWYRWCEQGHIGDKSSCYTACDHWNRVEEDTALLKSINVDTHRLSLEWSRIEPSPGRFSDDVIKHYRDEIELMLSLDIKPLVTLHHFSDPLWFADMGGWKKAENTEYFIEYARFVVTNLGDLVSDWVVFNEPNVYSFFGYTLGVFPPGERSLWGTFRVVSEMIKTHVKIYDLIHNIRKTKHFDGVTMVGTAMHLRIFDGLTIMGKFAARIVDYLFQELYMAGTTEGKLKIPLSHKGYKKHKGLCADFLGINYYTRNIVEFALDPSNYFHHLVNDKDLNRSDVGWDIYPEGIYKKCKKYYERYGLPIYITENGIADRHDSRRSKYIIDHLMYISKAIEDGIKVERYYHWTLMDNFEWLDGETARFGLFHNDFKTQKRTPRKSAELFSKLALKKAFTEDMASSYFDDEE